MADSFDLENSYAYLIYRTVRALRRNFLKLASSQGYDLYPEQWFVLVRLAKHPGSSQVDLAKDFEDRPSMTRALHSMKDKGWLSIEDDPMDRRKHQIFLTQEGQKLYDVMVKIVSKERKKMFKDLDDKDFSHFRKIINTIFENAKD